MSLSNGTVHSGIPFYMITKTNNNTSNLDVYHVLCHDTSGFYFSGVMSDFEANAVALIYQVANGVYTLDFYNKTGDGSIRTSAKYGIVKADDATPSQFAFSGVNVPENFLRSGVEYVWYENKTKSVSVPFIRLNKFITSDPNSVIKKNPKGAFGDPNTALDKTSPIQVPKVYVMSVTSYWPAGSEIAQTDSLDPLEKWVLGSTELKSPDKTRPVKATPADLVIFANHRAATFSVTDAYSSAGGVCGKVVGICSNSQQNCVTDGMSEDNIEKGGDVFTCDYGERQLDAHAHIYDTFIIIISAFMLLVLIIIIILIHHHSKKKSRPMPPTTAPTALRR